MLIETLDFAKQLRPDHQPAALHRVHVLNVLTVQGVTPGLPTTDSDWPQGCHIHTVPKAVPECRKTESTAHRPTVGIQVAGTTHADAGMCIQERRQTVDRAL